MELAADFLKYLLGFLAGVGARDVVEDVWRRVTWSKGRKKQEGPAVGVTAKRNGG